MSNGDDTDRIEDLTGHPKTGFDPDVCEGCPYRGTGVLKRCQLCGCPTINNSPMDLTGRPPEDCIRLDEHRKHGD